MQKRFLVLVFVAFILGVIVAPKSETKTVTKEVACKQEADWKSLKEIDDHGFRLASEGFNIVSEMFDASANLDSETFQAKLEELDKKASQMSNTAMKRNDILARLGYQ